MNLSCFDFDKTSNDIHVFMVAINQFFSFMFLFTRYYLEGGLQSTGHLSRVGTLLLPVKSICRFKTLFFLPFVPDIFGHITFVVLFYGIFLLGRLTLLSCKLSRFDLDFWEWILEIGWYSYWNAMYVVMIAMVLTALNSGNCWI